jgi:hypothetical protein
MTSPVRVENRTSAAEAVKRATTYGTAEPVPFVRRSFPQPLRCCPNWPPEKSNWDRCEVQSPLRDSSGLFRSLSFGPTEVMPFPSQLTGRGRLAGSPQIWCSGSRYPKSRPISRSSVLPIRYGLPPLLFRCPQPVQQLRNRDCHPL